MPDPAASFDRGFRLQGVGQGRREEGDPLYSCRGGGHGHVWSQRQ